MTPLNPKDLLLSSHLDPEQVSSILSPVGFKEVRRADANLQLIAEDPRARELLSEIIRELLDSLSRAPDPDQALNYFERFSRVALNKTVLLSYLKDSPHTLELLIKVFGSSPFMSEVLIRFPNYLYWVADPETLNKNKPKAVLSREIALSLRVLKTRERKLERLCVFKNKELLRIGVRDLLRKSSVEETTTSLSDLAEVIIEKVYRLCGEVLKVRYGFPVFGRGEKTRRAGFTVVAMGKLGGGELNFSSDIDLIYLYASDRGKTSGSGRNKEGAAISTAEYFTRLAQEMTTSLSGVTARGFLYRVDLRLRPEGKSGKIAAPLEEYREYYAKRGESWEKMALLKAWPVAGDRSLGKKFIKMVSNFIFQGEVSAKFPEEVKKIKEAIDRKMEGRGNSHLHVKLGTGGIREVEFIVQILQILFGRKIPAIRERHTLTALKKLLRHHLMDAETHAHLTEGYLFLRRVENSLQMVHENQTHSLPLDPELLRICARRLGYRDIETLDAGGQLLMDYRHHTGRIHHLFNELVSSERKTTMPKASVLRKRQTSPKRLTKK